MLGVGDLLSSFLAEQTELKPKSAAGHGGLLPLPGVLLTQRCLLLFPFLEETSSSTGLSVGFWERAEVGTGVQSDGVSLISLSMPLGLCRM